VADDLVIPGSGLPTEPASTDLDVRGNLPAEPGKSRTPEPSAAGIIPDVPIMRKQTYASPMSYIGITRRGTAWLRSVGDTRLKTGFAVIGLTLFLAVMYVVVTGWYLVIFGIFGLFTFPYRLIRRSHRKQEHFQKQQLATMQAMLIQQQQSLNESKEGE
jgi:hypothetical protein